LLSSTSVFNHHRYRAEGILIPVLRQAPIRYGQILATPYKQALPSENLKNQKMNKLIFLAAIVCCLTISCSNPNQPDNADNTIN